MTERWRVTAEPLLDGESIVVVTHPSFVAEAQRAHPQLVVYTADEIKELRRHSGHEDYRQMVRAVHALKRRFGGAVLPTTRDRYRRTGPSAKRLVDCGSKPGGGREQGALVNPWHGETVAAPLAMVTTDGGCGCGSPDRAAQGESET